MERRLTALLLVPRLRIVAGTGSKLRARRNAHEHLLDHASILEGAGTRTRRYACSGIQ